MDQELVRILLVDDHPVVLDGIRARLIREPDIVLLGEATSGAETLAMAEELLPDVVLMDMALPDLTGVELAHRLRETYPQIRILVFSAYDNGAFVFGALEAGARGYLLKEELTRQVVSAVRAIMRGEVVFSDSIKRKITQDSERKRQMAQGSLVLTDRELEILKLVAMFRTSSEIASLLVIEQCTVEYHIQNILRKLGKHTRREAARWAWEEGLVVP